MDKSNTIHWCSVSFLVQSSETMAEAAKPEGVIAFHHKKQPHMRACVIAVEIEQSICFVSSKQLSITFALKWFEHLKKALAWLLISMAVTSP